MTASIGPQTTARPGMGPPAPGAAGEVRRRGVNRLLLAALAVALLFAATYAFAWFQANRLSSRFMGDADASYEAGEYLNALVGYEEFDQARNRYVTHGGYLHVERIWSNRYSWPVPAQIAGARDRTQEILDERLAAADAEEYIRENTGRPAPYFAEIYLRLGELYEAEGATRDARDIFESVPELFPGRADLIERAQAGLARLGP